MLQSSLLSSPTRFIHSPTVSVFSLLIYFNISKGTKSIWDAWAQVCIRVYRKDRQSLLDNVRQVQSKGQPRYFELQYQLKAKEFKSTLIAAVVTEKSRIFPLHQWQPSNEPQNDAELWKWGWVGGYQRLEIRLETEPNRRCWQVKAWRNPECHGWTTYFSQSQNEHWRKREHPPT